MAALGILLLLTSMGLFLYQVIIWLQTGAWQDIRFQDLLLIIFGPEALAQSWVSAPNSWFGLHKILKPFIEEQLAVILFLMACIPMFLSKK